MNSNQSIHLALASASPRRRQLLACLGYPVELIEPRPVDESYPADMQPSEVAPYISRLKAEAYLNDAPDPEAIIVTADTVVIVDNRVIGKPGPSPEDACRMLRTLSGKTHRVITGVTLTRGGLKHTFSTETIVEFDTLTDEEIETYVATCKPFDKAGAYGIQEWIGYIGVKGIKGDYYNVMGLPLHDLYKHISQFSKQST